MSNINKKYEDNDGMYMYVIKKILSKDEIKLYNYFIDNEGYLTPKEQKLLINLLNIKCVDDCKPKIMNTTSRDILTKIIKHKVDHSIFFLKLLFILILIIASLVNRDTKFIKEHTLLFTIEGIIIVMLGTLSFFIMTLFRNKSFSFSTYGFVMLFYLILHILFEISGMYNGFYLTEHKTEKTTDDTIIIKHAKTVLTYTLGIIVFMYLVYILFIMSYVNDVPSFVKESSYGYFKFFIEMVLVATLNSIIFYPVAIDRQYTNDPLDNIKNGIEKNTFGMTGVLVTIGHMCLLHIGLQYTGFYQSINL
jgi:hypothetical protein